jgi:4'-phosphopantetheinyl transferase
LTLPPLSNQDVHLHFLLLGEKRGEDLSKPELILSQDEKKRAAQYRFDKDRFVFIQTRFFLRRLLGGYLNCPPASIRFAYTDKDKPYLVSPQNPAGLQFNVSHSGEAALLGFTQGQLIGVDLEHVRPILDLPQIVEQFFSDPQKQEMHEAAPDQKNSLFFKHWTRIEADLKASGKGLSGLRQGAQNFLHTFMPQEGHMASVAVGNPLSRFSLFEWRSPEEFKNEKYAA